jgi:serine/threonine protein kinase
MPAPSINDEFLDLIRKSGVVDLQELDACLEPLRAAGKWPGEPKQLAGWLVRQGVLTLFQAEQLLRGRWRGFFIGKYQILERLGFGGMGIVYLAEHKALRRRVAVKVLPVDLAQNRWFVDRFYKEAQAVAALNHPNIVCAHDVDHDGKFHFLVMEYVDGANLQEIVNRQGPMSILRACHYIRQAALGLQHSHERGLVHRDIKPGNLLLDRQGVVKVLDMGLAHFFLETAKTAQNQKVNNKRILGTEDYLAPEQIVNSDAVDIRADIYSLGATFYFLLTGYPPFYETSKAYHKLIQHLGRSPKPVRGHRPEVPEELAKIVEKMMAKNPWDRYQTPKKVAEALAPWTRTLIPPPPDEEMPKLSPAARRTGFVRPTPIPAELAASSNSWVVLNQEKGSTTHLNLLSPSSAPASDTKPPSSVGQTSDTLKETLGPRPVEPASPSGSTVSHLPSPRPGSESESKLISDLLNEESKDAPPEVNVPARRPT